MNILYLTYEDITTQPIIKSQVVSLLNFLGKNGVQSTLISLKNKHATYQDNNSKINYIFIENKPFIINIFLYAFLIYTIVKKDDIIHVRSYIPMFGLLIVKPFIKNKIIFDMRGLLPQEFLMRKRNIKDIIKSIVFSVFEKIFIYMSNKIVVVSTHFMDYILSKYDYLDQANVVVIPTLSIISKDIDIVDCKKKYFSNEEIILFVYSGSLEGWQNFEETILLFSQINILIPNSRLIIFSKNTLDADRICAKYLSKLYYRVDSLSYNQLNSHLLSCDFGFLLRENHIVNRVASPIKFSDYINSDTYVIATENIGDVSTIISSDKVGCVIPGIRLGEEEILELVKNIKKLFGINFQEKKYAFKRVQDIFKIENIAEKYIKLYSKIKNA